MLCCPYYKIQIFIAILFEEPEHPASSSQLKVQFPYNLFAFGWADGVIGDDAMPISYAVPPLFFNRIELHFSRAKYSIDLVLSSK